MRLKLMLFCFLLACLPLISPAQGVYLKREISCPPLFYTYKSERSDKKTPFRLREVFFSHIPEPIHKHLKVLVDGPRFDLDKDSYSYEPNTYYFGSHGKIHTTREGRVTKMECTYSLDGNLPEVVAGYSKPESQLFVTLKAPEDGIYLYVSGREKESSQQVKDSIIPCSFGEEGDSVPCTLSSTNLVLTNHIESDSQQTLRASPQGQHIEDTLIAAGDKSSSPIASKGHLYGTSGYKYRLSLESSSGHEDITDLCLPEHLKGKPIHIKPGMTPNIRVSGTPDNLSCTVQCYDKPFQEYTLYNWLFSPMSQSDYSCWGEQLHYQPLAIFNNLATVVLGFITFDLVIRQFRN